MISKPVSTYEPIKGKQVYLLEDYKSVGGGFVYPAGTSPFLTLETAEDLLKNGKAKEIEKTKNTATSIYPATSLYTSKSWGFYDATTNTYAEQISLGYFLVNADGNLQLVSVKRKEEGEDKKKSKHYLAVMWWFLDF